MARVVPVPRVAPLICVGLCSGCCSRSGSASTSYSPTPQSRQRGPSPQFRLQCTKPGRERAAGATDVWARGGRANWGETDRGRDATSSGGKKKVTPTSLPLPTLLHRSQILTRIRLSPPDGIGLLRFPDRRFPVNLPGSSGHPVEPVLTSRKEFGLCCVDPRNQLLGITCLI